MQRISFAPVLSATLSRDSCWIIGFSPECRAGSQRPSRDVRGVSLAKLIFAELESVVVTLPVGWAARSLGLFEDLDEAPALGGRQRTGLHDQDPVADAALVLLVVHLELAVAAQDRKSVVSGKSVSVRVDLGG